MQGVPKPLIDERVMAGGNDINYLNNLKSCCLLVESEIGLVITVNNLIEKRKSGKKRI